MNQIKNAAGHFSSLWQPSGSILIPTTETQQRKSYARAKELAKREQICREIEALTGKPVRRYARRLDGVTRRWNGVKVNQPIG